MVILTSFPPPEQGIRHREEATAAYIQRRELGKGTLYIAESRVSWVGENSAGFSLEYPSVALHAVSRDLSSFPQECLYLMIDGNLDEAEPTTNENGSDANDDDDEPAASEIRFVPENKSSLDAMYKAMSECQALHPDPTDSISEEEEGEEEEGCFDDADEEEDDEGAEYDVRAAEQQRGCRNIEGAGEDGDGEWVEPNKPTDEPMEVGQFDDAEPDH
ncbi:methylosome subunit pICln [Ixodes scapularis]|uniref:Methylosome subunit pICln n=1 Tax=Ixodes scapularis TaxID=6945 RepID=B7P9B2_IXOSC|nr:methylosome subunit pICln [Ixodes scapularis]XP_040357351.1 methylosome subunit pICln [Ixodes scapularis]EEC03184.1 chloride ion current inducer protein, putative [Ixodes scapularis]|eukprot:XP_002403840.1 chloride ion current inducer protein, putative [Ixodes scapularis]